MNGDGECNNVVLTEWSRKHCRKTQDMYELSFFFSVAYCVESAIVMFDRRHEIFNSVESWSRENKEKLIFQSDRKYMRMRNSFEKTLQYFIKEQRDSDDFLRSVWNGGEVDVKKAIENVSRWEMFGRFSAFLFLETFLRLTGKRIKNSTIEWKKGNTATSGLLNVYALDEEANVFDKKGVLLVDEGKMDKMLFSVISEIEKRGGNPNVTEVETSLCAYRKFHKGSRYNGYYLDRMLEEITKMAGEFPNESEELFEIRKESFDKKYLGEISGWTGIRKNMKKLYKETGLIL